MSQSSSKGSPLEHGQDPRADVAGTAPVLDPELLALPAPPRGRRALSMALLGAVAVAAAALVAHLRADVEYSFAPSRVADLGDVTRVPLAELAPNTYVSLRGTPMLSRMVKFERGMLGEGYAIFPFAGQNQIYVQVPLAALQDPARVAQGEFSGRLQTFGQLGGRLRTVRRYLAGEMGMPVSADSFVLLAEEPPGSYGWSIALSALGLAIMGLSVGMLLRWFREIR